MVTGPTAGGSPGTSIETLYIDIAARADQLVEEAKAAVDAVIGHLDRIEDKTEEMNQGGGIGGILKGALSAGLGFGLAQVGFNSLQAIIQKVKGLGSQLISTNAQMQMFTQSFTVLTGSAQEAGEVIEWVKEQAKLTPFDVPGLIQASQMLMTWGLDLKEWFTIVGDVAAGMQRPISQVVNAVGTLATGQTGEAVRRFRDLGINLRESEALTFDARGALITPIEEAIPLVKQIMEEKFGGMMESQSKTWTGVMSNIGDTWQQLIQKTGEPLFEGLNEMLVELEAWISDNSEELENFAVNLGEALRDVLNLTIAIAERISGIFQETVEFIKAIPYVEELVKNYEEGGRMEGTVSTFKKTQALFGFMPKGMMETASGIVSGKNEVSNLNDVMMLLRENMADNLAEIAGTNKALEEQADIIDSDLEPALQAGLDAVRELRQEYGLYSDARLESVVQSGKDAEQLAEWMDIAGHAAGKEENLGDTIRANAAGAIAAYHAYQKVVDTENALAEAADRAAAALAQQQADIAEAGEIAEEAAKKLQDRLEKMLEDLAKAGEEAAEQLKEDLADIEEQAGQAQLDAVNRSQEAIADARRRYARDQIRKQEQFNKQWARLIREQNDANVDAEADYQYARDNLIIEGDEKALADLDARHKMEGDRRERDQGQARGDLKDSYASQVDAAQEAHEEQIRQLEARLQEELTRIRETAEAEKAAKIAAAEEADQAREDRAQEMFTKLGELLYDATEGNSIAAGLVLAYWTDTYQGIQTEAINSAFAAEQATNRAIESAIQANAQLQALALTSRTVMEDINQRLYGARESHYGGYTPATTGPIITQGGEYVLNRQDTRNLERALGAPINRGDIQRMTSDLRKRVDVQVTGRGLGGAASMAEIRRELIAAFSQDVQEF